MSFFLLSETRIQRVAIQVSQRPALMRRQSKLSGSTLAQVQHDALIFCGSGMTHAVNKLQRILGLRIPEQKRGALQNDTIKDLQENDRPIVFVSHMEHHSNHTSWLETIADVIIIPPAPDGNIDLDGFAELLEYHGQRSYKIAAITACSNVTGIETPYYAVARMIHGVGGYCFVDFACSAPYVPMDMHPSDPAASLDAIYFSGHKFLGGPGTPGVLIFNKRLYNNRVPDQPGGGTILYSNPWNVHEFITDIEQREDAGTPSFYGAIKLALCIRLKETMGTELIRKREAEIMATVLQNIEKIPGVFILEPKYRKRLGIISFIVPGIHHDLFVKMLNDRFGVQARSGCSCAGTYGHYLLKVGRKKSYQVLHDLLRGEHLSKPGWIRLSIHPTMGNAVINTMMDAVRQIVLNAEDWCKDYYYDRQSQCFLLKDKSKRKAVFTALTASY